MPDLSPHRLLRRLLGATPTSAEGGPAIAASGVRAVAAVEARIAEVGGPGGAPPTPVGGGGDLDLLARSALVLDGAGVHGGLSAAVGMALSGLRATGFVTGPELLASPDALADAVSRRVPLVVHLAARDARTAGGTHASLHAAAATGAVVLVAVSAQEAVDLALVARRLAEEALQPVVVAMDPEVALAVQEVVLPGRALVERYLGRPGDLVHAPTAAQEMVFGRHRRRLPAWHDPARPMAGGALAGGEVAAAAAAARRAYLDAEVPGLLAAALAELAIATGRALVPLTAPGVAGSRVLLVAQGAAVETARALALRLGHGSLVGGGPGLGVVGVCSLHPFPVDGLVEMLRGAAVVAVLERTDTPLDGEGPLTREVRGAAGRLAEAGGRPAPRVVTALHGAGGALLRAADLELLVGRLAERPDGPVEGPILLGVDLAPGSAGLPRRQAVADALRRSYPRAAAGGLRAGGGVPGGLLPAGSWTVAFRRTAGGAGEGLAAEAAALVHGVAGGHLRGRTAVAREGWGRALADRFIWSPAPLGDPGDDVVADLAVCLSSPEPPGEEALAGLAAGGALLLERPAGGWRRPPRGTFPRIAGERGVTVWSVPAHTDPDLRREQILGALTAVLAAHGRLAAKPRQVARTRRATLEARGLDPAAVDRRVAAFEGGRDRARALTAAELTGLATAGEAAQGEPEAPPAVRRSSAAGAPGAESLAGLWERVAGGGTPLPEPVLATGTVPAGASVLVSTAPWREILPAFHPEACTGCGDCWTACPHGAIGATALPPQALLDHAMARAAAGGAAVDALRMVSGKLVAAAGREAGRRPAGMPTTAGDLFTDAFTAAVDRASLAEDRKAALRTAFAAVLPELAALPVARADAFFGAAESAGAGAGELFLLAVDPDACKGCGGCVEACETGALTAERDDDRRSREARALWETVSALPAPAPATLARAAANPEVGPLAAALLSPAARGVMAGGDAAEAGSGEALGVRLALGAAAARLAPRRAELGAALDAAAEELAGAIRGGMARALPTHDLDALARGLAALEAPAAEIAELTARVEKAFDEERVDVPRLRRLVAAAREIADLRLRLGDGGSGCGEALCSLVVGPGPAADWAGAWPANPFAVPVTVAAGGDAAGLARGLAEGQLRRGVETAAAVRRARLLVDAGEAAAEGRLAEELERLARLTWRDLTADERQRVPPLLLVASEDTLLAGSLAGLLAILGDDLPVKVLLLGEAHLGVAEAAAEGRPDPAEGIAPAGDAGLLALVPGRAFVAQSSCGAPGHLADVVAAALAFDGPALVRLHAPSPGRHGFSPETTVARSEAAVVARVWPLFASAPGAPGAPRQVDLAGNPAPHADWAGDTPAEWARGEARFAAHFAPAGAREAVLPLTDYMALPVGEREGKVPAIAPAAGAAADGADGAEGAALRVSPPLAAASEGRLAAWRTLRAMALELEVQETVAVAELEAERRRHRDELDAVKAGRDREMADLRWQVQVETARKLRGRLLDLARRRAGTPDRPRPGVEIEG